MVEILARRVQSKHGDIESEEKEQGAAKDDAVGSGWDKQPKKIVVECPICSFAFLSVSSAHHPLHFKQD